ncbi:XP_042882932.1uncharacterized protein LOC122259980 [Octopus vulgaris]|uniref:XP_042882932.1uncharacterized protein LOC122259980 n=1 Tax=Octopus vulgaris TaxID=6645 RepID=A0AA36F062_OCTVU|nr:XP_042882932.1uncharacterized protein LOC122259980 [Octopus vulgaris]
MKQALNLLIDGCSEKKVRILSDNKTVFLRLKSLNPSGPLQDGDERDVVELLHTLHQQECDLAFTWYASHRGIVGNELVDEKAKEGSKQDQEGTDWHYAAPKAAIKRSIRSPPMQHERLRKVHGERGERLNRIDERQFTRQEQVTLSRLRSGHHPDLRIWQHKIGRIEDHICRNYKMGKEMGEHVLLECPAIPPSICGQLTDPQGDREGAQIGTQVVEEMAEDGEETGALLLAASCMSWVKAQFLI